MANEVHMIYGLSAEQRAEIQEQGGELPAVRIVHTRAVSRLESAGFVVCDKDGNPLEAEPDPGPAVDDKTPVDAGIFELGDMPGEGN